MKEILGYQVADPPLYESTSTRVHRGVHVETRRNVILKFINKEQPSFLDFSRFNREYEIARGFDDEGVAKALEMRRVQDTFFIAFEDIQGESLKRRLAEPLELGRFLHLALKITGILGRIHGRNVIHGDINHSNVVWNPETDRMQIIDFGLATSLEREKAGAPVFLEGTLSYLSPEQTGRLGRPVDYRTDFYSLGVLFYRMLAGEYPFQSRNPMELIFAHIAERPVPLAQKRAGVPAVVSRIVMKLLEKLPEARYQSAFSIHADLLKCEALVGRGASAEIEDFPIAQADVSRKFVIPQKLYGRDEERRTLLSAFETAKQGDFELVLVQGKSGSGKTVLVNELRVPVIRNRGFFISGNFEELNAQPYAGFIQAFRELIQQITLSGGEQVSAWKDKVLKALGAQAQVMVEVFPELERLIGAQPPVPALAPGESVNRFHELFRKLVGVFPSAEHPLVLFLDNLQWADSSSLGLLGLMAQGETFEHLLIIAGFRDLENSLVRPFLAALGKMRYEKFNVRSVELSPLTEEGIGRFIGDALGCPPEACRGLAALCGQKTGGSPLYMHLFLRSLHDQGLVAFDRKEVRWRWDEQAIRTLGVTENVVDMMTEKIRELTDGAQRILALASCFGREFEQSEISALADTDDRAPGPEASDPEAWGSRLRMQKLLEECSSKGLLSLADGGEARFAFAHDRVLETAYQGLDEERREETHLRIGRLLLKRRDSGEAEERLFDIANHFNQGGKRLTEEAERRLVVRLNLLSGEKARASAAFQQAYAYFKQGIALLPRDCWEKDHPETLRLHTNAAEAAYLCGDYENVDRFADLVVLNSRSPMDRCKAMEAKILSRSSQNRNGEAIRLALPFLGELGVRFPKKVGIRHVLLGYARLRLALLGRKVPGLSGLPPLKEGPAFEAMRLLTSLNSAAYVINLNLALLICLKQVGLSLRHGNSSYSQYAYATFGMILGGVFKDFDLGAAFGDLSESLDFPGTRCRSRFVTYAVLRPYKNPAVESIPALLASHQFGMETGDVEYAAYCLDACLYHAYVGGRRLGEIRDDFADFHSRARRLKQKHTAHYMALFGQTVAHLTAPTAPERLFEGGFFDRKELDDPEVANNSHIMAHFYFLESQILYLLGKPRAALESADKAWKYLDGILGFVTYAEFHFWDSMIRLAVCREAGPKERRALLKKVSKNQRSLGRWAQECPANHSDKLHLVEAEKRLLLGDDLRALELYDLAKSRAEDSGHVHLQALAHQKTAEYRLGKGKLERACRDLNMALYYYEKWGANAVIDAIHQKHKTLIAAMKHSRMEDAHGGGPNPSSDYSTSFQKVTEELGMPEIFNDFMRIVEKAGEQGDRDVKTGLWTEQRFNKTSKHLFSTGETVSFCMFDLDNFKRINDTYGHPVGDIVLKKLHEIGCVVFKDEFFRCGGEEFCGVVKADLAHAFLVAEKFRRALEDTLGKRAGAEAGLELPTITCSGGVAECPLEGREFEVIRKLADDRAYAAKLGGKNRVVMDGPAKADGAAPTPASAAAEGER